MMYHPRPQHPPSTREFHCNPFEASRDQHSSSRSATSDVRSLGLLQRTATHRENSEMMVEPPQHAYASPPLTHPGNYGPPSTQYSPTTYEGFQSNQSRPLPQSPTFALRPAQLNHIFSHIEHPPIQSESQVDPVSSDEEDDYHARATTQYSRRSTYNASQAQSPYNYASAYDSRNQQSFVDEAQPEMNRDTSQITDSSPYTLTRLPAPLEPETPVGMLRPIATRQTRGRKGSDSSIGSMLSNTAVVGDAIYRTDTVYHSMGGSIRQVSGQFQSRFDPAAYSHKHPDARGVIEAQAQAPKPNAPNLEAPYMPPHYPQHGAQEDHPFVYQGVDWDFRLRGLRTTTAADTDTDAMSVDQERNSSSRGSSEGASSGRLKNDRKTPQAVQLPGSINGDGKRKATMACHFCRFRKLRCDGRSPCGHCEKRQQECTYDATIRRRGPGRKNKSAQETAKVQLAQRQREEAGREAEVQNAKLKTQARGSFVVALPVDKRDASMQTSPQTTQYPFSPRTDGHYGSLDQSMTSGTRYIAPAPGSEMEYSAPRSSSPTDRDAFRMPCSPDFQTHFRPPQGAYSRPQERQAFTIAYEHAQTKEPENFPTSLAHQQQNQSCLPGQYNSFYRSSPDRWDSSQHQNIDRYASGSRDYNQAYGSNRYHSDAHTDTDSVYAYSEGANVTPSRYEERLYVPPAPRSDIQAPYTRGFGGSSYAGETSPSNRADRDWGKSSKSAGRR